MFLTNCGKKDAFFNWEERYREDGMYPYDLKVLHELLKERIGQMELLTNNFNNRISKADSSSLLQISNYISLDSAKIEALKEYVYRGNKAFFISNKYPYTLINSIYKYDDVSYYSVPSDNAKITFPNSTDEFDFDYTFNDELSSYNWSRISVGNNLANDTASEPVALSYLNDSSVNFIKVDYGNGAFYFHSNPILFTNYNLKEKKGFDHATNVFSNLNEGKMFWDISFRYRQNNNTDNEKSQRSPLMLMFSHKSLKWAWFSLMAVIGLFLIFKSKREQRIIPIMPINTNDSLEFAKNVGNLYFKNGKHQFIALEMFETFMADVRNHYQIDTNQNKKKIIKQLQKKSGIEINKLEELFEDFKLRFNDLGGSSKTLIKLYTSLNHYYNNRK